MLARAVTRAAEAPRPSLRGAIDPHRFSDRAPLGDGAAIFSRSPRSEATEPFVDGDRGRPAEVAAGRGDVEAVRGGELLGDEARERWLALAASEAKRRLEHRARRVRDRARDRDHLRVDARRAEDAEHDVVTLGYADRFGDEGVIGLGVLAAGPVAGEGTIELLLLSCRVIGRGVEDRLLDRVEELARDRGYHALTCRFVPTERNGVAASFLADRSWTVVAETDDAITYREELA